MQINIEGLLVLIFLIALLLLGWATGAPFFETLGSSRLSFMTVAVLPCFLGFALWRRRFDRAISVFRDWWQILGILLVYENLKHMHANRLTEWLGIAPKDLAMLRADEFLFGKCLALYFDSAFFTGIFSQIMWFFYIWIYYLGPVALLGYIYFVKEDDELFQKLRRALVFGLLGGYILYILVPVAGPLFQIGDQFTVPILTQPVIQRLAFSSLRYNWDCFPSLHTAIPWLLTCVAWPRLNPGIRTLAVLGSFGVTLSTVVLRFHYGIDLVAGLAWAGAVWAAMQWVPTLRSPIMIRLPWPALPVLPVLSTLRGRVRVLGFLFILTGCVGLLAEQAFEKLLGTLLGASTPAAAVVLAVYFLGLTIGGAAYGPLVRHRVNNPLRVYAGLEAGVAAWCLLLFFGYERLIPFFTPVLALGRDSLWSLQALRLFVASLWILPPTILMGMTFPAIVDALDLMRVPQPGRAMSRFYTLNLIGAILGAFLGPYVSFPRWGVDGTLLFAYAMDAVVALLAFQLAARLRRQLVSRPTESSWHFALPPASVLVLLAVAFVSGFLFFSLEVVWTHLISAVLGNSIYAFAAMLALVLMGLGLGGFAVSRFFPTRRPVPAWGLAIIFLASAVLLVWQHGQWPEVPHRFSLWGGNLETFAQGEVLRWIQVGVLLLPSATVLGMVYPALFRLELFPDEERAILAGQLGAVNSTGCILGALVTGFVLIPTMGSEDTLLILILGAILSGLALGLAFTKGRARIALGALGCSLAISLAFLAPWNRLSLTSGEHVYFKPNQVWPNSELRFFHEDTLGGITTVVNNPVGTRGQTKPYLSLLTNGKFQGNDAWESEAQTGFALVPILHTPNRGSAMVIGLGTGHSAAVVEAFGFQHIDVAEISPGIVAAAKEHFSSINNSILEKPHVRLFLEDGRNHMLLNKQRYDLITMEITSVWFAGSTNLYSQEFYQLTKARLQPGGIFQQWIQLHHIGPYEVGSVIATLRRVFPYVSFWRVGGQGILLASLEPQVVRETSLNAFLAKCPALGIPKGQEVEFLKGTLLSRLFSSDDTTAFVNQVALPVNTDANRYLEYASPRYNLTKVDHASQNLAAFVRFAKFQAPAFDERPSGALGNWLDALGPSAYLKHLGLPESPLPSQGDPGTTPP
jgi:spermidine synthase